MKSNRACRYRRFVHDDVAASDVLGSILLVGITVASAGAFSALILSIDGPPDTLHVSLDVAIGPGADMDWGVDDAELRIRHFGGEPLESSRVVVRLVYPDGSAVVIQPDFMAGTLYIGQEWTRVISAEADDEIGIQVIAETGTGSQLIVDSGGGGAGAVAFTSVYATGFTANVGLVDSFLGAQSDNDGNNAAVLSELASGGGAGTTTLAGTTTTNTGATNPGNVLLSDDQRTLLPLSGAWVAAGGFSPPGGASDVTQVIIGFEGNGPVSASVVNHEQTVAFQGNVGLTVSSPVVTAVPDQFYLAAIENSDTVKRTVTGVSGMNLAWTRVEAVCADENIGGCIEVWKGSGTPVSGIVTATFAADADKAAIAVSRYSGVDLAAPVQASTSAQGPGTGGSAAWSLAPITGTSSGRLYVALGSHDRQGSTWTNPTSVRQSLGETNEIWLSVTDGASALGANTASGTLIGGSDDWHAVGITLRPIIPPAPKATLSYTVAGSPGPSDRLVSLTASDAQYILDVTGDRTWSLADLSDLAVRVTASDTSGGPVLIDQAYVRVTTTSGSATFALDVEMDFAGIPATGSHAVDLRYRATSPGDGFRVEVSGTAGWRTCPGVLAVTLYTTFSCQLVAGEHESLAPRIRFVDVDPLGPDQGVLHIEYARISTT